jgi:hypothetical protein
MTSSHVSMAAVLAALLAGCVGEVSVGAVPVDPSSRAAGSIAASSTPETQGPVDPSGVWEVRWDRTFAGWQPPMFNGTLQIQGQGAQWAAQLLFRQSQVRPTLESLHVDGNRVEIVFRDAERAPIELSALVRDDRMIGEIRWKTIGWTPFGARRTLPGLTPPSDVAGAPAAAPAEPASPPPRPPSPAPTQL